MHILIVDSSKIFHQIVSNLFRGSDLTPVIVNNAAAALEAIKKQRFELICSAYQLPDMTGVALCQEFRSQPLSDTAPFVLITSAEGEQVSRSAMAAGITEVFHRDDIESLVMFIRRLLQLHDPIDAHVLLVEDSASQRAVYTAMLENCGLRVSCFADASRALNAFKSQHFDVVITDIVLEGTMSGIGLVNAIRRTPGPSGETPVLALTAFDNLARRIELFHLGVNDYVLKPAAEAEFRMRVRNLVLTNRLLTNLRSDKEKAEDTAQVLLRAIEQVSSGVAIAGADGRIAYTNPSFSELTNAPNHDLIGQPLSAFNANPAASGKLGSIDEHAKRRADGTVYWATESISPVRDGAGVLTHYIAIHNDITEQRSLRAEVDYRAQHDHLTGLINRGQLEEHLQKAITAWHDHREPATLAFIDLGNLRTTNDAFGFEAGDALLQAVAEAFKIASASYGEAIAARVESGRLALFLRQTTGSTALQFVHELLQKINAQRFAWGTRQISIETVAGIATLSEEITQAQQLFQEADSATQVAKQSGAGEIVVFDPEDPRIIERHGTKRWLPMLHEALENERLVLFSQLLHPLKPELPLGFEFLVRLHDKNGQLIPPAHFLPTAEHYGLMPQIDRWVIRTALAWIDSQPQEAIQPFYNINISGQSLSDPAFVEDIAQLLDQRHKSGSQICFEVTESCMVNQTPTLLRFIKNARAIGCRFALDDFGTGFASYGQLKKLPVQMLKVDGQLVMGIGTDSVDRAMVKSIGEVAHAMSMVTVGEFVETQLTLDTLREIGIDYAQGYFLGRPGPLV
jgi:diguanylate cyclase (GGDEF)-like protein/PAS domain S-box-containing protein